MVSYLPIDLAIKAFLAVDIIDDSYTISIYHKSTLLFLDYIKNLVLNSDYLLYSFKLFKGYDIDYGSKDVSFFI